MKYFVRLVFSLVLGWAALRLSKLAESARPPPPPREPPPPPREKHVVTPRPSEGCTCLPCNVYWANQHAIEALWGARFQVYGRGEA